GHVDDGPDRGSAEIKHQQRSREPREERTYDEGEQLVLDDIEAERARLHGVLAACLQYQAERRLRKPVKDGGADRHEAERDPVIGVGVDGDDVGNGETDFTAGEVRE